MPTRYKRCSGSTRGNWTENQLVQAVAAVQNGSMGVNEAASHFDIPATTLRRRMKTGNFKVGSQGPSACLGTENENKIVLHIKKLQSYGFAPTREDVRVMAFKLAEQLQINHRFNRESGKAGYDWLHLFLMRHLDLSIRKSEGVSLARAQGMRRKEVDEYFKLLGSVLEENQLFDKPGQIFNMDETGMQLNNKPGHVVAAKGSKNVANITSVEKGETITVITCFSAEGAYIPPTCIMKGKNKKAEFEDGLPPGSKVYMNEKSAYINSDLFFQWLKEQFLPRKPLGKVVLLLDGHGSHCNNIEMLEFASQHDIILVCLPSHTTQFLQPLDRGFFRSLKLNYYSACNLYIPTNPTRRLTRLQFGGILASAWVKSATVNNAMAAFKATGIVPFNPTAIPDEAFLSEAVDEVTSSNSTEIGIISEKSKESNPKPERSNEESNPKPGCSNQENSPKPGCSTSIVPDETAIEVEDLTPGKMLNIISPIPSTSTPVQQVRKRSKQLAAVLNSEENIITKKIKHDMKEKKAKRIPRNQGNGNKIQKFGKQNQQSSSKSSKTKKSKRTMDSNSSSESEEIAISLHDSSSDGSEEECCRGCNEPYTTTKKKDDWLKCIRCLSWYHESCSDYTELCVFCAKDIYRRNRNAKQ